MANPPQRMADFMECMNTLEQHLPIAGFYDFGWVAEKAAADPERTLFVDVGGVSASSLASPTLATNKRAGQRSSYSRHLQGKRTHPP